MRDFEDTPYGEFVWWIGTVEDTFDDDSKLGRVRVRIVGYHPPAGVVPTEELPLAPVLNGGTARINNGEMVLGFFMDGHAAQQPFILGVIGGSVTNSVGRFFGSISSIFKDTPKNDIPETQTAFVPNPMPGSCIANPRGTIQDANGTLDESTLVPIDNKGNKLKKEAAEAYLAMVAAAKRDGISWVVNDSYRSYAQQVAAKSTYGNYAASPGKSNHGCGLAVDLGVQIYQKPPYDWLMKNASKFGFKRIYVGSNPQKESWHWEYTVRTGTDAKDTMKTHTPETLPNGTSIHGETAAKKPKTIGVTTP